MTPSSSQNFQLSFRSVSARFSRRSEADPAAHFSLILCGKRRSPCRRNFRKISPKSFRENFKNFQPRFFGAFFSRFFFLKIFSPPSFSQGGEAYFKNFFRKHRGVPTATSGGKRPQADSARVWGRPKRVFGPFFGVSHGSCVTEVVRYMKDREDGQRNGFPKDRDFHGSAKKLIKNQGLRVLQTVKGRPNIAPSGRVRLRAG